MSAARILVVEDEHDLADVIVENLIAEGYEVSLARDGDSGLATALGGDQDLIILDVMLPGVDGFTICRKLRAVGVQVPILFLTARDQSEDRIRGLEEGGDDYLTKPFELRELLLRIAAILRRSAWYAGAGREGRLRFAGHCVDLKRYQAELADGSSYELTHREAQILKLLSDREGEVVTRDEILDTVWGYGAFPTTRTIDNFILRIRRRFEPDPGRPVHFHTIHGAGYRFTREPVEAR